jgi:hypothetical protein
MELDGLRGWRRVTMRGRWTMDVRLRRKFGEAFARVGRKEKLFEGKAHEWLVRASWRGSFLLGLRTGGGVVEGGRSCALRCCGHASDPRRQHHPPAPPSSPNPNAARQLGMGASQRALGPRPTTPQQPDYHRNSPFRCPSTIHLSPSCPSPSDHWDVRDPLPPPAEVPQPAPQARVRGWHHTTRQDPVQMPAPPWPITTRRDPTPPRVQPDDDDAFHPPSKNRKRLPEVDR